MLAVLQILKKSQDPTIYWRNYLHVKDAGQTTGEGTTQRLLNPLERMQEKYRLWIELYWSAL